MDTYILRAWKELVSRDCRAVLSQISIVKRLEVGELQERICLAIRKCSSNELYIKRDLFGAYLAWIKSNCGIIVWL